MSKYNFRRARVLFRRQMAALSLKVVVPLNITCSYCYYFNLPRSPYSSPPVHHSQQSRWQFLHRSSFFFHTPKNRLSTTYLPVSHHSPIPEPLLMFVKHETTPSHQPLAVSLSLSLCLSSSAGTKPHHPSQTIRTWPLHSHVHKCTLTRDRKRHDWATRLKRGGGCLTVGNG